MRDFWLCFVPLFVAVDAIGALPMFLSITDGMDANRRRAVIPQSVITASVVAVAFLWFGPLLLEFLGITVPDFTTAGGILLLTFALADLLQGSDRHRQSDQEILGAVPIGVPLITGPAVLTTCVLLKSIHGCWMTTAAVLVNIILAGCVFRFADPITRALGRTGSKTISKLANLLLAAIAVMLIRRGVTAILTGNGP